MTEEDVKAQIINPSVIEAFFKVKYKHPPDMVQIHHMPFKHEKSLYLLLLVTLVATKGVWGGDSGLVEFSAHHPWSIYPRVAKARDAYPLRFSKDIKDFFHTASMDGNLSVFQFLVHNRAYVDMEDFEGGRTPLFIAAMEGHLDVVRCLLLSPGIGVNDDNMNGATPLLIAAEKGHLDVVRALLDAPFINVNAEMKNGATALHAAAQEGHLEIIKALLSANGINVNAVMRNGARPLHYASQEGHLGVVAALLCADGIDVDEDLQRKIVNDLQKQGVDVNTVMENGETLLYVAAKNGYMDMVKTLLSKGADVNLGKSPLVAAIENNHSRIADFLVKNGSDRTIVIQYVLGQGNVVKLLREREIKNKK